MGDPGIVPVFLDNARTYLTFLAAGMSNHGFSINSREDVASYIQQDNEFLVAISQEAVFCAASAYIGNSPNFMAKNIAQQIGVRTPIFFGYIFLLHVSGPSPCARAGFSSILLPQEDSLMFTGLVEEVGSCLWLRPGGAAFEMAIVAPEIGPQVRTGDSIAVNGCCLTVAARDGERMHFDLLEETLRRTNLGAVKAGSEVNLERALRADGRLGGHFVQGHVDCAAGLKVREDQERDLRLEFELPASFSRYVAWKGSICVNGVSLTVAELREESFSVWIIPHTRAATNLGKLAEADLVNLEFDILAKYAERLLTGRTP